MTDTNTTTAKTPFRHRRLPPVWNVLFWVTFLAAVVFAWPQPLGGRTGFVVVSGHSMEPTYYTGDLVVTRTHEQVNVNDVVVYDVPDGELGEGMSVVHRVVAGDLTSGLTTLGDNNLSSDPWHPRAKDVRGVVVAHVPHVGAWLYWARSPIALATLAAAAVLWLVWPARESTDALEGAVESGDDKARRRWWRRRS